MAINSYDVSSRPVRWFDLQGLADPVPEGRLARDVDRGRRIGIALSHTLYRMTIRGEEQIPSTGPVVFVSNHTAFMDGPILFGRLPRRVSFLVKSEALVGPLGWLLRTVGQYSINRHVPSRQVLLAALAQLRAGGAVGIFPEGQRTAGLVRSVFPGAGWLAARSGATVVPIALRGTARPVTRTAPRLQPRVHARIGKPFAVTQGGSKKAVAAATDEIQQNLSALVTVLDNELRVVEQLRNARGGRKRP